MSGTSESNQAYARRSHQAAISLCIDQQLMDRLEAVEVSFNQVLRDNLSLRIDSEYFGKYYLACLKQLEKRRYRKINDFSYVTDGIHESIDFDEDSHILSFSAKYPKENYFDLTEIKKISKHQHNLNPATSFYLQN
jgi:hypothetical protein